MSAEFAAMHQTGTFLLVNVHDAGSAALAQFAGAQALGTTSSGHAYTLARADAVGALRRDEAIERIAQICAAVSVPVSADAENGWAATADDVAVTIKLLAQAGAAGACIEDWSGDPDIGFYDIAQARERVTAAVEAARSLPEPFVICARAEAFLHGHPDPVNESIKRLQSFAEVGADCLYAPGPRDPATLRTIVDNAGGPVNALIGIGSTLTMTDAAAIGIRRVSVGGSLYRATMATFHEVVQHIVTTGDFNTSPSPLTDAVLTNAFELARADTARGATRTARRANGRTRST